MSKIICDVCGTSYPDTATQCPICGSVRPGEVAGISTGTEAPESQQSGYTYVKGGRFSKANVKKRNQGKVYVPENPGDEDDNGQESGSNKGLIVAVVLLLLAIVAVVGYIVVKFYGPELKIFDHKSTGTTQSISTTQDTKASEDTTPETTMISVPCTAIKPGKETIRLKKKGASELLNVDFEPKNTTQIPEFLSSDESVATVSQDGKITAVGNGEATITILCGDVVVQCNVVCEIEEEQEETKPQEFSTEDFKLNREDITFRKKKEQHQLYNGEIPKDQIKWTSENEKVATVKNGLVTAVGEGMTTVYAEYADVKLSCIIRCVGVGPYEEEKVEETQETDYKINKTDVTIGVGESFELTLTDKDGQLVSVTWVPGNPEVCSVSGNTITGKIAEITTVTAVYDEVVYSCIVRVVVK